MQTRKQHEAACHLRQDKCKNWKCNTLLREEGELLWVGARRNVPSEACDCMVAEDWDRKPITGMPSALL